MDLKFCMEVVAANRKNDIFLDQVCDGCDRPLDLCASLDRIF